MTGLYSRVSPVVLTEEEDMHAGQEWLLIDSQIASNEVFSIV